MLLDVLGKGLPWGAWAACSPQRPPTQVVDLGVCGPTSSREGAALTRVFPITALYPSQSCSGRRGTIRGQPRAISLYPTFHKAQPQPPGYSSISDSSGRPPLRLSVSQPLGRGLC